MHEKLDIRKRKNGKLNQYLQYVFFFSFFFTLCEILLIIFFLIIKNFLTIYDIFKF
ncbi:hypothetical protein RhiirB3_100549, partial [Rhizophagus irregularis]